jgi:hypothetical protein
LEWKWTTWETTRGELLPELFAQLTLILICVRGFVLPSSWLDQCWQDPVKFISRLPVEM